MDDPPDNPLTAFGRFHVLHQVATGSAGPVYRGDDRDSGVPVFITHLQQHIPAAQLDTVVAELRAVAERTPDHANVLRMIDAGRDAGAPYIVTAFSAGEGLDVALREYGPAAIDDALPRLRRLADALDQAAAVGISHGALTPGDILVSAEDTQLSGLGVADVLSRAGAALPDSDYTAPERRDGAAASLAADQYSLAAISYEWLFGRRPSGAAEARFEVPRLPDVDSDALAGALVCALAPDPNHRFESCTAFVTAMEAARAPAEPDLRLSDFQLADLPIVADPQLDAPWSDADSLPPPPEPDRAVLAAPTFGHPVSESSSRAARRGFGAGALIASLIAGLAIGGAAGYWWATTRSISAERAEGAERDDSVAVVDPALPPAGAASPAVSSRVDPSANDSAPSRPAPRQFEEPAASAPATAPDTARLLVRSSPAGASVTVDGTPRGVTPLALRDLPLGTRTVVISRPGYAAVERQVTLSADRPSRSLEVALSATPRTVAQRPDAAATTTTALVGSVVVESRPSGAIVSIDGKRLGPTPLTVASLAPGAHSVRIERVGYRTWTTTIAVKAGERARVAASLVGGQE